MGFLLIASRVAQPSAAKYIPKDSPQNEPGVAHSLRLYRKGWVSGFITNDV
jgi:hypothetical protein